MHEPLVGRLAAAGPALTTRVLEEMYRDPFWDARFGARGRSFAEQDGQFHLSYLTAALTAGDPSVLTTYARWLQQVLTTRGMCTLHIRENFERLAAAITDAVEDGSEAAHYLGQAIDALKYDAGPARELQELTLSFGEDRHLLSYVADAVALGRADTFVRHVAWLASVGDAQPALTALRDTLKITTDLSPQARAAALETLQAVA